MRMYVDGCWPRRYGPFAMLLSRSVRPLPTRFIPPCLPTASPSAPSGDQWLHEIKHDGS
jgi:hypothetical protein